MIDNHYFFCFYRNKPYIKSLLDQQLLLKLGDASSENSGKYKCKAVVNEVPIEKTFHVVVKGKNLSFPHPPVTFTFLSKPQLP
jgi:hypothetical protein